MSDTKKYKIPGTTLELSEKEIYAIMIFVASNENFIDQDIFNTSDFEDENGFLPMPEGIFLNKKRLNK